MSKTTPEERLSVLSLECTRLRGSISEIITELLIDREHLNKEFFEELLHIERDLSKTCVDFCYLMKISRVKT